MRNRQLATAVGLTAVPALVLGPGGPAAAGDRWTYRSSQEQASTEWVELGPLNGVEGNVHVGFLEADGEGLTLA
jgi:hypothetical protein